MKRCSERLCALCCGTSSGGLGKNPTGRLRPANLGPRMSVQGRDGEVSALKTGRSTPGGPSGRCRHRRRTASSGHKQSIDFSSKSGRPRVASGWRRNRRLAGAPFAIAEACTNIRAFVNKALGETTLLPGIDDTTVVFRSDCLGCGKHDWGVISYGRYAKALFQGNPGCGHICFATVRRNRHCIAC